MFSTHIGPPSGFGQRVRSKADLAQATSAFAFLGPKLNYSYEQAASPE